jgi:hypothetical protein
MFISGLNHIYRLNDSSKIPFKATISRIAVKNIKGGRYVEINRINKKRRPKI